MSVSLAVFRLLLNASRLPGLEAFSRSRSPSTSEPSRSPISSTSLARGTHHHILEFALLHPTVCGASSGTSAPVSLCCLVTLGCSGTPSATPSLVRLLLAMLSLHGSWGPNPGCFFMGPGVPIPGCFTFFTSLWHLFHPPNPMISTSTFV